ncbi:cupin domain-containing protein [Actinobacillus pleuropneumoniae]|uniref:cupin domain-containing protein n=1 Tax=Actinobacillus pleuropneumoniae TaxID=715 RepID=UPI003B02C973
MKINIPYTSEEFKKNFFEKKPFVIKGGINDSNRLSWKHINELLPRCNLVSEDAIKLMYKGKKLSKEHYLDAYNDLGTQRFKFNEQNLYGFMREGATLVANGIVNEPSVDCFSQEIARFSGCHTFSSLYIAFNTQSSFKSHWDSRDIFALQMQGRKRWIIHAPTFNNPLFMHKSKDMPEYNPNLDDVYMDIILEAGDILYLPRGWWHDPIPVGEETVHLAIGIFPAYANNYLTWVANNIVEKEAARVSLFDYESDLSSIEDLSNTVSEYILDKNNFSKFMEDFYGKKRVERPLNLEIFADHRNSRLNGSEEVSFVNKNYYHNIGDKLVSNGYRISVDESFKKIISILENGEPLKMDTFLSQFPSENIENISKLIWDLSYIGVIKVNNS